MPRKKVDPNNVPTEPNQYQIQQQSTPTVYQESRIDQQSFKFANIFPIPYLNTKNVSSSYLKSDNQSWTARRVVEDAIAERLQHKRKNDESIEEPSKFERTIIFHPGSKFLRIGKCTDQSPLTIPSVIARKKKNINTNNYGMDVDDNHVDIENDESWRDKLELIQGDLRTRMRAFKLRGTTNGQGLSTAYNEDVKPEEIPENLDNEKIDYIYDDDYKHLPDILIGDDCFRITDDVRDKYTVNYPFLRGDFNHQDYDSSNILMGDIETLLSTILVQKFGIKIKDFKYLSFVFVIPNVYSSNYITEMSNVILNTLGVKQIALMQEGNCVAFGCGVSSACVVDIGARKTSVACVEEGLVIPESRMELAYGGDDITNFFNNLLTISKFPYEDRNIRKIWDWNLLQSLKERLCTLSESDLAVTVNDFVVRKPHSKSMKYSFKIYEDGIKAALCLFSTRVINFEKKFNNNNNNNKVMNINDNDSIDIGSNSISQAMQISTLHLASNFNKQPSLNTNELNEMTKNNFDVSIEASKMPLHVAIVNSIATTTIEERIKRFASSLLIVGGTSNMKGIDFGIESRVKPLLQQQFPFVDKVQIVPPPKDVENSNLAWNGMSVLSKLEVSNELWVRRDDFNNLGLRALKDRTFCMQTY